MESINIYIFIMKNKRYLFIVCRICTFNCHIDIFNLNNVEIVEGLVILRRMTRCVTALFPKKFSMKKCFPVFLHAYSFFVSMLLLAIVLYIYWKKYSLVDEPIPIGNGKTGTKKQHSITLFKYKYHFKFHYHHYHFLSPPPPI